MHQENLFVQSLNLGIVRSSERRYHRAPVRATAPAPCRPMRNAACTLLSHPSLAEELLNARIVLSIRGKMRAKRPKLWDLLHSVGKRKSRCRDYVKTFDDAAARAVQTLLAAPDRRPAAALQHTLARGEASPKLGPLGTQFLAELFNMPPGLLSGEHHQDRSCSLGASNLAKSTSVERSHFLRVTSADLISRVQCPV